MEEKKIAPRIIHKSMKNEKKKTIRLQYADMAKLLIDNFKDQIDINFMEQNLRGEKDNNVGLLAYF